MLERLKARARPHGAAHDALHGRGGQALRPDRDRRPRQARGARLAAEAQGVDPGHEHDRGELLVGAATAGRRRLESLPERRRASRATTRIPRLVGQRAAHDVALLDAVQAAGVAIASLSVQSTTLDDVFVHYTGRQLRDALQEANPLDAVHDPSLTARRAPCIRIWAIIERDLRRFRRSPMLVVMSLMMPLLQLVVLGYAFGGNVKHLEVGVVDQDDHVPAAKLRDLQTRSPRTRAPSTLGRTPTRARRWPTCATAGSTASSASRRRSRATCSPERTRRSR